MIVISYSQCYTNLKSYIILSEISSYAQNQRQQEPHYRIYRFRRSDCKKTEKEIAKLEAKKAAEVAKKVETEAVLKKLLASGMTADDVLKKLK